MCPRSCRQASFGQAAALSFIAVKYHPGKRLFQDQPFFERLDALLMMMPYTRGRKDL
jgi:hypothetical protein